MELALDFEAFAGRPLPPAPQSKFVGGDISLQEKSKVLRLIVTLVGRATERESIFPVKMTHHCRSLTSMGAGTVMGLEGRPVFARPTAVGKHLERLRTYGEARWAQKQKARAAKRQAKTKGPAKKPAAKPSGDTANPERKRCPAKGGAKSALKHYTTDFYAKQREPLPHRGTKFLRRRAALWRTEAVAGQQHPFSRHQRPGMGPGKRKPGGG